MAARYSTRRLFCRHLFAANPTVEGRILYLDGLAKGASEEAADGRSIAATSQNGASVQFQALDGVSPSDRNDLIDEAYDWAAADTLEEALAMISGPVREVLFSFSRFGSGGAP